MVVSFLQGEIIWKRRCMYLTWIELQLWILWMTSSVKRGWFRFPCRLWSCSNWHERVFFLFFLIGGTQSWNLTSLTNQNLVGFFNSSGVFWYQAVIWYDFLATKKPSRQKHLGPLCLGLRQRHPKCFGADAGQMVSPQRWLFVVTLWPGDLGRIPPWSNVTWRVLRNDVYIYRNV